MPVSQETLDKKLHTIQMNGREVFRFATRVMASATVEAVEKAGLTLDEIDLLVPHQANKRIIETAARSLRMPMDRIILNIDRYGNTSSASIPIAVCEAMESGRIHPDDNLVLVGFGGGLTWGALTLKWLAPERRIPPTRKRLVRFTATLARVRSHLRRFLRWLEGLIWRTHTTGKQDADIRKKKK
jgi:3-oxoacyl-[acyl-carrier-protein] synthase-3